MIVTVHFKDRKKIEQPMRVRPEIGLTIRELLIAESCGNSIRLSLTGDGHVIKASGNKRLLLGTRLTEESRNGEATVMQFAHAYPGQSVMIEGEVKSDKTVEVNHAPDAA